MDGDARWSNDSKERNVTKVRWSKFPIVEQRNRMMVLFLGSNRRVCFCAFHSKGEALKKVFNFKHKFNALIVRDDSIFMLPLLTLLEMLYENKSRTADSYPNFDNPVTVYSFNRHNFDSMVQCFL